VSLKGGREPQKKERRVRIAPLVVISTASGETRADRKPLSQRRRGSLCEPEKERTQGREGTGWRLGVGKKIGPAINSELAEEEKNKSGRLGGYGGPL